MSTEINIKVSETIDNGGDTAIIFFHEPSIFYYSQYTLDIIKAYASKHKYDVLIFNEPDPEYYSEQKQEKYDKGVCWHKAMACIWSVNNTDYKRFAWLDSDVIILHMDEPIDKFFTRPFNFSTDIFSRWRQTQINSGVFFFENTILAKDLFMKWWSIPRHRKEHNDQDILWDVVQSHLSKTQYIIHETELFNPHWKHCTDNSWCLHMMGTDNAVRRYVAKLYKETIHGL